MIQYTLRRLIASIPVLFGILLVTFALGRSVPGDPCKAILGERASQATCEEFIKTRGLDRSIPEQFAIYMRDVTRGDLGNSIKFSRPVMDIIIERMPLTIELSLAALILAVLVGVPLGIISAIRRNSPIDVGTMLFANIGVSIPVFFLGLMLAYLFAVMLADTPFHLPPSGRLPAGVTSTPFYELWGWENNGEGIWQNLQIFLGNLYIFNAIITGDWTLLKAAIRHLILPSVALSTIPMAIIARMTRSSMLEVLGLDYIRTARAKGLNFRQVTFKHALRNALLPVVTIVGLQLGALLGGAVLTETIFGLAGVGRTLFEAITGRDYPIVQAFTLVIAIIFVAANLIVDISYAYLDPRIKLD
ncbi:MAG: ABC transporter permease [Anaerolineales bacterium]|nr:ABC transporter permease [Anaerolineales bacterium]MCB9127844.1 ABC transporter permease [Ardenticatenales bacterium]